MVALSQLQMRAVETLSELWPEHRLVIIGATAIGHHIGLPHRGTKDLDLVVTLELDEFPGVLAELEGWTQAEGMEHRFTAPDGLRLDILPAGPKLVARGYVDWPSGHRMSLLGMDLAITHAELAAVHVGLAVAVASAASLVVLKMVAWLDRPERAKDLADLSHLMELHVREDDERRFSDAMVQLGLRFEDQSPYLLGVEVRRECAPTHRLAVERFLRDVPRGELAAHGPARWRVDENVVDAALAAFERGFAEQ